MYKSLYILWSGLWICVCRGLQWSTMLPPLLLNDDVRWGARQVRGVVIKNGSEDVRSPRATHDAAVILSDAMEPNEGCWSRERRFWMYGAQELRPARMASNYAGPILFVLGLLSVSELKPLAAVVATFGIYETLRAWQMQSVPYSEIGAVVDDNDMRVTCCVSLLMLGSIVGHAAVYVPYIWLDAEPMSVLWSTLTLLFFLGVYRVFNAWPYSVPPLHAVVLCLCIQIVNQW